MIPKPPVSVLVGNLEWVIILADAPMSQVANAYGWVLPEHLRISFDRSCPPNLMADVAIHELIHAIFFSYGFPPKLNEEEAAKRFAIALNQVLRDNSEFFAWVAECGKKGSTV